MSKTTVLTYENVYTGERFTECPTSPARADLPSQLFANHVQKIGERLVQQQVYQMGCLLKDSKTLHKRQQHSRYAVQIEELGNESASLVGSALSRHQDDQDDHDVGRMMRVGETLYSATFQAELLTYSDIIRQIVKNSISQIEIVHGRQVQRLQHSVEDLTHMWHSGSSNAQLHMHWKSQASELKFLEHWHHANKITQVKGPSYGSKLPKRKRGRRQTMMGKQHDNNMSPPSSPSHNDGYSASSRRSTTTTATTTTTGKDGGDYKSNMADLMNNLNSVMANNEMTTEGNKFDTEIFREPHTIKVKDQLEIVFQAKFQKELIRKVKKEFDSLHQLVRTSQMRRLNISGVEDEHGEELLEEEEEEYAEVESLKKKIERAKVHLVATSSEVKMTTEKLNSIRAGTQNLVEAYESWDGKSLMTENDFLAPYIRHEIGYKTKDSNGTNKTNNTNNMNNANNRSRNSNSNSNSAIRKSSPSMSRIISIARRKNLAAYIATGGDGKSNDDDNSIQEKLQKARTVNMSTSKTSQMADKTGFVSPSMKKMFMLSLAYEAGGGQNDQPHGTESKMYKSMMHEVGGVNKDPRFQRMQLERFRVMMKMLNLYSVPSYIMSKFKSVLDEHEMAMAKVVHTHEDETSIIDIESKLMPLHRDYADKIKAIVVEHALPPKLLNQILTADERAMTPHLRPALNQVLRVIRVMKKFGDRSTAGGGGSGSGSGSGSGGGKVKGSDKGVKSMEDHTALESDWDHDHRLQRVHEKSAKRLAEIFNQHQVEENVATILHDAYNVHHCAIDTLLKRQVNANQQKHFINSDSSMDVSKDVYVDIHEQSLLQQSKLDSIKEEHNLTKELIADIIASHDLHHINVLHGDGSDDDEEEEEEEEIAMDVY